VADPPGPLPLYDLPGLAGAHRVYVTEGEKCTELVRELGLAATTASHGAKSPAKTDWTPLAGLEVVIVPDHAKAGEGSPQIVSVLVLALDPRSAVKVLRLPLEGEGDDIEQWLDSLPKEWSTEQRRVELERRANETPRHQAKRGRLERRQADDAGDGAAGEK